MVKAVLRIAGLAVIVALGLLTWSWRDRQLTERALAAPVGGRQAIVPRVFEQAGVLPDVLAETSGLAVSRRQPGVLWSHNDSGDGPTLYALDVTGRLLAVVPVAGAMARDWEDISSGPCPAALPTGSPDGEAAAGEASGVSTAACLFLADTGDNDRVRPMVTVYVVREPRVGAEGTGAGSARASAFSYRYPVQPEDTEAVAVTPDGDVTLVSKGRTGTIDFFGIQASAVSHALVTGETITAEHQGDTGIAPDVRIGRHATGAAVSPDGMTLAVRTYTEVYFYRAAPAAADGRRWRGLGRCLLGTVEPQGEGIDYLDDDTLLVTSEAARGQPATLRRLQCSLDE